MAYSIQDFLNVSAAGGASWSPDSKRVAYLSNETGTTQAYLRSVIDGQPEQLTDFQDGVAFVHFSPCDDVVIVGAASGGNELTQLYLLNLKSRELRALTNQPTFKHYFGGWSHDGLRICYSSNERNGVDFDVYVMNVLSGDRTMICDLGKKCVPAGFSPVSNYVLIHRTSAVTDHDLYIYDVNALALKHFTPHQGNAIYTDIQWRFDESMFYYLSNADREYAAVHSYTLDSDVHECHLSPEYDIEWLSIDPGGDRLLLAANRDGYLHASMYALPSFEVRKATLPSGNVYRASFSRDGQMIALSVGDSCRTSDIWTYDIASMSTSQITHSHQAVPSEVMVEPTLIHYVSFDGLSIPAFVYLPFLREDSENLPVLVHIHGGPEEQFRPNYQALIQYFVHQGYAVIAPNVRGSAGYGKQYLSLDDKEKRLDSVRDIVALRHAIAEMPHLDATRVALMGASYGGYMVLACMAFYPGLWAAGVDIVGIVNFVTFLENTSPYRRALREAEYGSLDDDRELLERISPIHSIDKIDAPLLVIHGANDPRVPLSEAEQLVAALKGAGRSVELLVYKDEGHGLSKLKNRLDAYPKIVEFLGTAIRKRD